MDVGRFPETSVESQNVIRCQNPENLSPLHSEELKYRSLLLFVLSIKFIKNSRTRLGNTYSYEITGNQISVS